MKTQNTINQLVKNILAYSLHAPFFLTTPIDTDCMDDYTKDIVNGFYFASIDNTVLNPVNVLQNIKGVRDVFQDQVLFSKLTTYFKELQSMNVTERDAKDAVKQLAEEGQHVRVSNALYDALAFSKTDAPLEEKLARMESSITSVSENIDHSTECSMGEAAERVLRDYMDAEAGIGPRAVKTGFDKIDEALGGLYPCETTVIAGISGSGKTQSTLQIMEYAASKGDLVFMISMEMTEKQLIQRYIANKLMVEIKDLRDGKLMPSDRAKLPGLVKEFGKMPYKIEYGSGLSYAQLEVRIMRMIRKYGNPKLIAIDYLQLLTYFGTDENKGLGDISKKLTILAKKLNTHIIILSQLTKDNQRRTDTRPILSDLRGTSQIGNDATNVWFTYNAFSMDQSKSEMKGVAEILQRKSRYGASDANWEFGWIHGSFRNHVPSHQDRMIQANVDRKAALKAQEEAEECPFDL